MKIKQIFLVFICVLLGGSNLAFAQSYGTSENKEYFESEEYYKTYADVPYAKVENFVCDDEAETLSFQLESFFDGAEITKDVTFIIDKETYIPENNEFLNFDKFVSGEHKWIAFYIAQEDDVKISTMGIDESVTIHVDSVYGICENIVIFPSPEQKKKVERLNKYGIMIGDENGNFHPYQILTRAELTKIAVMMSNPNFANDLDLSQESFLDVTTEHWAYPYIVYAKQYGIIEGYEDGTFMPENGVTAQEAIKIIVNLLGYSPFAESNGGYPSGYLKTASRYGILKDMTLDFEKTIIREEVATLIDNALDVPMMTEVKDGEYIICDGSSHECPLSTLATKNFSELSI